MLKYHFLRLHLVFFSPEVNLSDIERVSTVRQKGSLLLRVWHYLESCRIDVEVVADIEVEPGELVETNQHGVGQHVGAVARHGLSAGHGEAGEGT